MRKKLTLVGLILTYIIGYTQPGKVKNAYSNFENGNLLKAKELIDEAILNQKSMDDPLTWIYRSEIYIGIYNNTNGIINIDDQALPKAIESLKKTEELDVNGEYLNQINNAYVNLSLAKYNLGVGEYNEKKYNSAGDLFSETYYYANKGDVIDTNSVYNAAIAYNLAHEYEKASNWYKKLVEFSYDKASVYSEYSDILIRLDKIDEAFEIIKIGRELYPEDYKILIVESNLFLNTNQHEKALTNLQKAVSFDENNYSIYHAMGSMYHIIFSDEEKSEVERMNAYEESVKAYKKVIELNPDFFDAVFNLGAIIFNKGVYFITKADKLPFNDKNYESIKKKGEGFIVEAIPFLERAIELQPDDSNTLITLKQIYLRIGDIEKYKAVDEKLKALEM